MIDHFELKEGEVDKEKLQNAINEAAATLLLEAEVVDGWRNPISKETYSIAKVDFSRVQERMIENPALTPEEKASIKSISRQMFSKMKLDAERGKLFS